MNSFTIPVRTAFTLTWTLTDQNGAPINNAVVTATLYAGRSPSNPNAVPGVVVPPIDGITLAYVPASNGQYSAAIPASVDPPLDGTGYILVINATVSSVQVYHAEQQAIVETAGSVLDLTTVDLVKGWLTGFGTSASTSDDSNIQACITAWGFEFLNRTGLGDQNGDFEQSPFTAVCDFTETYDGKGTYRLFPKNRPIKNVTSLTINGCSISQSAQFGVMGYVIDGTGKSISLRQGIPGTGSPSPMFYQGVAGPFRAYDGLRFWNGIQNVALTYSAGFTVTPADIVLCANKVVALNYRRRSWVDESSRAMAGGGGTTRYRDWDIPIECQLVVDRYTRTL